MRSRRRPCGAALSIGGRGWFRDRAPIVCLGLKRSFGRRGLMIPAPPISSGYPFLSRWSFGCTRCNRCRRGMMEVGSLLNCGVLSWPATPALVRSGRAYWRCRPSPCLRFCALRTCARPRGFRQSPRIVIFRNGRDPAPRRSCSWVCALSCRRLSWLNAISTAAPMTPVSMRCA